MSNNNQVNFEIEFFHTYKDIYLINSNKYKFFEIKNIDFILLKYIFYYLKYS